nr:S66 peptidase family protein [Mobilitalea sibirica]
MAKGYKIGVTATSAGFETEVDIVRLESAIKHFNSLGYPVVETDNVRKCIKGRSSDGKTRAKELLQLMEDPEVGIIMAASGGDYLFEMLPHLDFDAIQSYPKWFQGFSDNTGMTYTLTTHLDMATIYGNNFSSFGMEQWHRSLYENIRILEGQDIVQNSFDRYQDGYKKRVTGLEGFFLEENVNWKNIFPTMKREDEIHFSGRALGGCLDVLLNLVGTGFDKTKEFINRYQTDGILWYLESFDLGSEALARGLWQLKEAGWFSQAKGFIFGRPAMYKTYTDTSYEEVLLAVLGELNVPIIMDADIGHKQPQFTMINGAIANVYSKGGKGSISFERR